MSNIPQFHSNRDWTNPADFPTHQNNEAQNRADLQEWFSTWESYWNNQVLPALNGAAGGGGGGSSGDGTAYLPLSGGTMAGVLRLFRDPQLDKEAATKAYVDAKAQTIMTDGVNASMIDQLADQIELLVQRHENDLTEMGRLTVRADSITGEVSDNLGYSALVEILKRKITLEVSEPTAQGDKVTANIILKVFDVPVYGQILLNGNVDVSGQLSADALYANYGEISDLHVDYLDTSRRIPNYLAGNTGKLNFIRAHDQVLEFVEGTPTGATEQAQNPNGALLYWPMDVSGLPRGADGYPRYNGERVFTTTTITEYPVMVYSYSLAVKRAIMFAPDATNSNIANVYDTFGAGNAQGLNRAFIVKTANAFEIIYTTSSNKVLGVHMDNNGYVDIDGLRKTTSLDFSRFHEGYFTETVQGAAQPKEYRVAFDANGVPTGITDEGGNTVNISW